MIKIAICDDEPNIRAYLTSLIRAQSCPCEIVEYASAGDCLADTQEIDLLFLDIKLAPDRPDGMALARKIREQTSGPQPIIIFVSGYERYVFDAFDVGAFYYLLKPVDEEKFARVFARAVKQIQARRENPQRGRVLTLHSANTSKTVPLDSICYIESSDHKVVLHLRDGEFACYAKIRDLELELQGRFFRIHKGYLVNLLFSLLWDRETPRLRRIQFSFILSMLCAGVWAGRVPGWHIKALSLKSSKLVVNSA